MHSFARHSAVCEDSREAFRIGGPEGVPSLVVLEFGVT
jgi:hypothetical protein